MIWILGLVSRVKLSLCLPCPHLLQATLKLDVEPRTLRTTSMTLSRLPSVSSYGHRGTAGPRPVCWLHTKDVGQEDYYMPCLPNSMCLCHLLLPLALNSKTLKNPDQFGPKTDIQKEMQTPSESREKMAAVLEQAVHLLSRTWTLQRLVESTSRMGKTLP
jgi:hypothetical protein